jgi:hypothetical protein
MINRRTSFFGKRNIASDGTYLVGGTVAQWIKAAGVNAKAFVSLSVPKGFGILADAKAFRTTAATLNEQIAMKEALTGNAGDRLTPTHSVLPSGTLKLLTDPRLKGLDISKYEYSKKIFASDGKTVLENITIHYLQNNKTGQRFDFKFKN